MTRARYSERYLAGEHVSVWRELIELGSSVSDDSVLSDALQVCDEIVRRASHNLRILHDRLLELGYHFACPDAALRPAAADAVTKIDVLERELGGMPLIGRAWYAKLESVDFRQAKEQLWCGPAMSRPVAPDIFGLGSHPVLVFQNLNECRRQLHEMNEERERHYREIVESGYDPGPRGVFEKFLPLGAWASSCEAKGFALGTKGVDCVFYNDGGGDTSFVDELRMAFRYGGFPFWKWGLNRPDFYSPCEFKPNFARLLPILREGLVAL